MANYANQLRINIPNIDGIKHPAGEKEAFLQPLSWDKLDCILFDLEKSELKLYFYFLRWAGRGYYEFSPADIELQLNMSENTARAARKNLEHKGYLTLQHNNTYLFNVFPDGLRERYLINHAKKVEEHSRLPKK